MQPVLENQDYSFRKLQFANFHDLIFKQVNFFGADLTGANFDNCLCIDCDFSQSILRNVSLVGTDFQASSLNEADISGANLFHAKLENADLTAIISDITTKFFALHCPVKGAFLGYKKCYGHRIVQLLIPSEARRSSATTTCCRCDKAKVLSIKDMHTYKNYNEAVSYVDDHFIYRVGEWVEAENFNPNRWVDSTGGIHFWLTQNEAENYL